MALTPETVRNSTITQKGELRRIHIFMTGGGEQLSGLIPVDDANKLAMAFKAREDVVIEATVYAIDGGQATIYVSAINIASMIVEVPDVQAELDKIIAELERQEAMNPNKPQVGSGILTATAAQMGVPARRNIRP